jgi:RsiW-degrading membrane proteinase PrsW (M82 family)
VDAALSLAVGLLPVLVFLVALVALDSYKLLHLRSILWMLAFGALSAEASLLLNTLALEAGVSHAMLTRYVAPLVEESLKGSVIVVLLMRNRIGFLVDAAIRGFAIGAGFAAVENVHYFLALADTRLILWILRGFGTAVMHGGVTAIMAVVAKHLVDLRGTPGPRNWLPGLAAAFALHAFFNHFILPPEQAAIALLVVLPLVFSAVFRSSERSTRRWLGVGFDTDSELLESLNSGRMAETRIGEYLVSLRERFDPEILVDMICLIRLHLELSVKAKGILLAREAGFDLDPDPATRAQFDELRHLESNIGRTGNMALKPIFNMSSRDLWQFYLLGDR